MVLNFWVGGAYLIGDPNPQWVIALLTQTFKKVRISSILIVSSHQHQLQHQSDGKVALWPSSAMWVGVCLRICRMAWIWNCCLIHPICNVQWSQIKSNTIYYKVKLVRPSNLINVCSSRATESTQPANQYCLIIHINNQNNLRMTTNWNAWTKSKSKIALLNAWQYPRKN